MSRGRMLGIGGAIIVIPLLLFVPPALGYAPFDMKVVAGLSMMQVLFAALSGVVAHRRNEFVSRDLILSMGIGSLIGSFGGGIGSVYVPSAALAAIFASIALAGAALMFLPRPEGNVPGEIRDLSFNRPLAFGMAVAVGLISGMVGAGGAFILIPLMLYVLRIPTRITIGSSLGIVLLSAIAGSAGKITTGQIVYPLAAVLVIGALPGAQLGSYVSKRIRVKTLKLLLTIIIAATAARMWYDLLTLVR